MNSEITEERTRVRLKRALDLCEAAVSLQPAERESYLLAACEGDEELRRTAAALLNSSDEAELNGPAEAIVPPDPRSLVGRKVGAYQLKKFIAQGGMGAIYLAERADGFFDRQVAIKFILGNLSRDEYLRFRREARILALLQHPNLIFLFDAGLNDDGRPYLVMEYVEGASLRDFLKERGALPREQVADIVRQVGAGLDAAHQSGIIHRDIKPANIIVGEQQGRLSVKILDFGIAYAQNTLDISLTGNQIIGTALYLSPEQLSGASAEQLTPAADIYSLGLSVYEMLTGLPAVVGKTWTELAHQQLNVTPTPPSERRPDLKLPAAADRVMMKVLNKDPRQRYQTAMEFAADLEAALSEQWAAPEPQPDRDNSASLAVTQRIAHGNTGDRSKTRSASALMIVALITVVTVAIVIGSYLAWPRNPAPATPHLSVDLQVQSTPPRRFENCNFALLKPEIAEAPKTIKAEDTLLIFSAIDDQGGVKRLKETKLTPGEYLFKFTCVGFKSVNDKARLQEDPQRPGHATIRITLEPE